MYDVRMAHNAGWNFVDKDGDEVVLQGTEGRPVYYKASDARGWMHCYSIVPDQKGRYWVWTYKPVGKGARKGGSREYMIVKPRWFRIRRKAKNCAEHRLGLLRTPYEDHR
jgi:hypothetical protein